MTIDGPCLRELRQLHCLSQEALADQAGVGLATLARLEREQDARCRPRTLVRLADTLGEHPATITRALNRLNPPTGV
jgi:transcriptional regulator with XRE-family HTH domain